MDPPIYQNPATLFQTRNTPSVSGPSRTPSAPRLLSNRMPSTSELPPFDVTFSESSGIHRQNALEAVEGQLNESLQQTVSKDPLKSHSRHPLSSDPLGVPYGYVGLPAFSDLIHSEAQADVGNIYHTQNSQRIGDQSQQTLLRRLLRESYGQSDSESLLGGNPGTYNHPNMNNQTGSSTIVSNESSRIEQQSQYTMPALSRTVTQPIRQKPIQNYLRNHNTPSENASSLTSIASDATSKTRPRLDPISRPYSNTLSSQRAVQDSPGYEIFSVDGRVPRPDVTASGHELPLGSSMGVNDIMQQTPGIPFARQKRTPTPTRVSPPTRSPGVIGSGRPSASVSKNDAPPDHNTFPSRWSQIGIIGNGRPGSSMVVGNEPLGNRGTDTKGEHESMIPFSVLRIQSMKEDSEKREHGIVGQLGTNLSDDNGQSGARQTDGQSSLLQKLRALSIGRRAQEPSQETDMASFEPETQAFNRNWPPSQDKAEPFSAHAPLATLKRQATPLQPSVRPFHPQPTDISVSAADQTITNEAALVLPQHLSSALPSMPTFGDGQVYRVSENPQPSPFYNSRREETSVNEKERDELSHAIFLLLSARERVLTLAEQRVRAILAYNQ